MAIKKKVKTKGDKKITFYEIYRSGVDPFGNRLQRKRKATTKEQANRIERELIIELEDIRKNGYKVCLSTLVPEYLQYAREVRNKTKGTLDSEKATFSNHVLPSLGNTPVNEIKPYHIDHILDQVMKEKSGRTRRHCYNYLNSLFKYAMKKRLIDHNPIKQVDSPLINRKNQTILTADQITLFLEHCDQCFPHWKPHFMIVLHCGLRAAEARGLVWGAINWDQELINVRQTETVKDGIKDRTKSGEAREVPMSNELIAYLLELKRLVNPSLKDSVLDRHPEFMRNEQSKVVRDVCRSAGLPECTFHNLRSACITNWITSGRPTGVVMKMAGHKRLSTTEFYFDLAGVDVKGATADISFLRPKPSEIPA